MENLLTIAQAAETLAIHPKHFRREFVNKGKIEVISLGKSAKGDRISSLDLKKLVEGRRITKCFIREEISGGSSSKLKAKLSSDPLGLPKKEMLKNASEN